MFDDVNEQTIEDEGPVRDNQGDLFVAEIPQGDLFDPDSLNLLQARAMDRGAVQSQHNGGESSATLARRIGEW